MVRNILLVGALLIGVFFAGVWFTKTFLSEDPKPIEESTILIEKINKVCKLVTVEGHFVEFYDYVDFETVPFYFGYFKDMYEWATRTEAKMRVTAKVLVGYDLANIKVDAFPEEQVIRISQLPEPEVLSVDHTIDQFDKEESIFRRLSDEEYVEIGKGAEEMIRKAAGESDLIQAAKDQGGDLFDLIRFMVENAGWKLEIKQNSSETIPLESNDDPDLSTQRDSLWSDY